MDYFDLQKKKQTNKFIKSPIHNRYWILSTAIENIRNLRLKITIKTTKVTCITEFIHFHFDIRRLWQRCIKLVSNQPKHSNASIWNESKSAIGNKIVWNDHCVMISYLNLFLFKIVPKSTTWHPHFDMLPISLCFK